MNHPNLPVNLTALLLVGLLVYFSTKNLQGQSFPQCGTMEYLAFQKEKNPSLDEKIFKIQEQTLQWKNQPQKVTGVITIPVVVHIVYNQAVENISEEQILSQIEVLNQDFRRLNADRTHTPADFLSIASDTEIEFCLANVAPAGYETNGITRTFTPVSSFDINDQIKFSETGGKDHWPSRDYLNIWVGNLRAGLLGYAQFPGGNATTDGIVVDYQYFGTNGTATPPFHLGRTTTHEVGHWLNLQHTWGGGGCGVDDGVEDTPLSDGPNFTAAPCTYPGRNSCAESVNDLPDMFQNYMDYSRDACMNLFTTGQKGVMRPLFAESGFRSSLLLSSGCAGNGQPVSCVDGVQNGTETGIDCGGTECVDCSFFCDDLVQNGDETGVDCGGSCPPCPPEPGEVCSTAIPLHDTGFFTADGPATGMGSNNPSAVHSDWYVFQPTVSGTMSVNSCGGGIDTRLFIYKGTCNSLTQIDSSDDDCEIAPDGALWASESMAISVAADTTYFIEWDNRWSDEGFTFLFSFTPDATTTRTAIIPALSEWAKVIFTLLIINISMLVLKNMDYSGLHS